MSIGSPVSDSAANGGPFHHPSIFIWCAPPLDNAAHSCFHASKHMNKCSVMTEVRNLSWRFRHVKEVEIMVRFRDSWRSFALLVVMLAAALVLAAACGDDDDESDGGPTTTQGDGGSPTQSSGAVEIDV